jgi:hypothetical protein
LRHALELSYDNGSAFESDTIVKTYATVDTAYYQSIAGKALDPDDDALSFVKHSGPQWLDINSQGILTGTPGEEDVGTNVWLVRVNTDDGTDVA